MKHLLHCLLGVLLAAACTPQAPTLRSGDLVFVGLPADASAAEGSMSAAIAASTGDGALHLIHVGLIEVAEDTVFVIDATLRRGVARRSLATFVDDFTRRDGSLPVFLVRRPRIPVPDAVSNAKAFCGEPYDSLFLPGNNARYCSELIRDSYRTPDGGYLFETCPMNWKDANGEIPAYWTRLFGRLGMEVPQDVPGTNPQQMEQSLLLEPVAADLVSFIR